MSSRGALEEEEEEEERIDDVEVDEDDVISRPVDVEEEGDDEEDDEEEDDEDEDDMIIDQEAARIRLMSKDRAAAGGGAAAVGMSEEEISRKLFLGELAMLMYGSGDESRPMYESVCLLEDMVVDFIQEMTKITVLVAGSRDRVKTEDLLFALRDRPRLSVRAQELLEMHKLVRSHHKSSKQKADNLAEIAKEKKSRAKRAKH